MENEEILEISTSLAAGSLTLFLGTGFSKYMTDDKAPNWLELLYECAHYLNDKKVLEALFKVEGEKLKSCNVELTVCAQILEEEFINNNLDIRERIAMIIKDKINRETVNEDRVVKFRKFLLDNDSVNIVTTNYDSIITDFVFPLKSKPIVDGNLIPKAMNIKPIYHIHGSIEHTDSIVLTEGDYFIFLHKENYMSKKLYTLIQETTLVILGYSLGDFNLNRILNEAKELKLNTIKKSDIYHISRNKVEDIFQRYYYTTFGVNVLQNLEIDEFLNALKLKNRETASLKIEDERHLLVLKGKLSYANHYLKLKASFSHILLRLDAFGYSYVDQDLQELIKKILERKRDFTHEDNAWDQYEHLAEWLCLLGSSFEVEGTILEKVFLESVQYSFLKMSKDLYRGYSWKSHSIWKSNIEYLKPRNKMLIEKMIRKNTFQPMNAVDQIMTIKES